MYFFVGKKPQCRKKWEISIENHTLHRNRFVFSGRTLLYKVDVIILDTVISIIM